MIRRFLYIIIILVLSIGSNAYALQVVPGLYGHGTDTRAAYGSGSNPTIYRVDSTNPDRSITAVGDGTYYAGIRAAMETSGPRVIIFEISGTITINGYITVRYPYMTVAGETAPSPGITLRGATLRIWNDHILIHHIRIRTGDDSYSVSGDLRDCISMDGYSGSGYTTNNVVIDHCSMSWGVDELLSVYYGDSSNITISNSIMSEALANSIHSKGEHSMGPLLGGSGSSLPSYITFQRNVMAHNRDRNPWIAANYVCVVNNVIYNAGTWSDYFGWPSATVSTTIEGNLVKPGPNSGSTTGISYHTMIYKDVYNNGTGTQAYLDDNKCNAGKQTGPSDWSMVYSADPGVSFSTVRTLIRPTWPTGMTAIDVDDVLATITNSAGARPADRDSVDDCIISDVINGTGAIVDHPNSSGSCGPWPTLAVNTHTLTIPSDPHGDGDSDGYTNLEEWIHAYATAVEGGDETPPTPSELRIIGSATFQ